jgi:hypothetical protein
MTTPKIYFDKKSLKELVEDYITTRTPFKYARVFHVTKHTINPAENFYKYEVALEVSYFKRIRRLMLGHGVHKMTFAVFEEDIKYHSKNGKYPWEIGFARAVICKILVLDD